MTYTELEQRKFNIDQKKEFFYRYKKLILDFFIVEYTNQLEEIEKILDVLYTLYDKDALIMEE